MSLSAGYPFICGAGIEAASPGWGTAVNMTDRIPVTKETLTAAIKQIEDDTLRGISGKDALSNGEISVSGNIECDMRYTLKSGAYFCGSDLLLSAAMGGAPAINSNISTLFLTESPTRPVTIAMDKKVGIWEFESVMFKGFKLSWKVGTPLMLSLDAIAHRVLLTGTENEAAQFTALAANGGKRILFGDTTFRLGDLANALAAGDAIGISEATLTYEGNMSDPEFSSPDYGTTVGAGTHGDNATTHSPNLTLPVVRNGKRDVTLELTCPRYMSNQLFTWRDAGTELQFDAKTSIDSVARTSSVLVPRLMLVDVQAPTDGPQLTQIKVKAKVLYNGGSTSGSGANIYMINSVPTTNKIPEEFQVEILNSTDGRTAAVWS
jgi:hypothetical protein